MHYNESVFPLFCLLAFSNASDHCASLESRILLKHGSLNRTKTIVQGFQSGIECGFVLPSLYSQIMDSLELTEELDISIRKKAGTKNYITHILDLISQYYSMSHTIHEILDQLALCPDVSLATVNNLRSWLNASKDALVEYLLSKTPAQCQLACHLYPIQAQFSNASTQCSLNQPFLVHNNNISHQIGPVRIVSLVNHRYDGDLELSRIHGALRLNTMGEAHPDVNGMILRPGSDSWQWKMYYHWGHDRKLAKVNTTVKDGVRIETLTLAPDDAYDTVKVRVQLSKCVQGQAIYLFLADDCNSCINSYDMDLAYFESSTEIRSDGWKIVSDQMCSCVD